MKTKQTFKVHRNGKVSYTETYLPVLKRKAIKLGNSIDYFFVNNEWPREA